MLVGVQRHPYFSLGHNSIMKLYLEFSAFEPFSAFGPFSKCTEACDLVILFSGFHERFWRLAHFRNAQRHVAQIIFFLVLMSVFGIWPILEIRRGMRPRYIFSRSHEHFFAFVGFKLFLAFCPFSKRTEACDPVVRSYFFSFS